MASLIGGLASLTKILTAGGNALAKRLLGPNRDQRRRAAAELIDRLEREEARKPGGPDSPFATPRRQDLEPDVPEEEEYDPTTLPEMKRVSSSNIHSWGWRPSRPAGNEGLLYIRFLGGSGKNRSGEGPLYRFGDTNAGGGVSKSTWNRLYSASSAGRKFWDLIRVRHTKVGHRYVYEIVGLGLSGLVPRQLVLKRGQAGSHFVERRFQGRTSQLSPGVAGMRGPPLSRGPGADQMRFEAGNVNRQGGSGGISRQGGR